nr:hypothetical protein [Aquitalea pelogenes]
MEQGFAFGWLAWHRIAPAVAAGRLRPLPLAHGGLRKAALYLVLADPSQAGPATLQLADCLRAEAERWRDGLSAVSAKLKAKRPAQGWSFCGSSAGGVNGLAGLADSAPAHDRPTGCENG